VVEGIVVEGITGIGITSMEGWEVIMREFSSKTTATT
jgi:hypothetical protein